jgi:small-conductance mechanosensitive channel
MLSWLWSQSDKTWFHFAEGLFVLVVMVVLSRFVQPFSRNQLKRAHLDPAISLLASRLIYVAWMISAVIVFISLWLSNPTLVFGSFGVFALAFGLAFQDILKNFLAGMFLLLERPFRIGDEITVDNRTGIVEDVQFRTTTMRTTDGEEVLVPNSIVFSQTIVNRTRYPARQFAITIKVPADVRLDGLVQRVRDRLASSADLAKDPPPHVGLQPSADGGVALEVRYWLDYRSHDPLAVQAALGEQIYQAIQAPPDAPASRQQVKRGLSAPP